jgi:hypothetical protein
MMAENLQFSELDVLAPKNLKKGEKLLCWSGAVGVLWARKMILGRRLGLLIFTQFDE